MMRLLRITVYSVATAVAAVALICTHAVCDSDGSISIISPDAVCVVDGDYSKMFKPGDKVEVFRFNKPYATGNVVDVKSSYMAVKLEKRDPGYFVQVGDTVRKPAIKKEKLKSLRATIRPEASGTEVVDTTEVTIDAGSGGSGSDGGPLVVETHKSEPGTAEERLSDWRRSMEKSLDTAPAAEKPAAEPSEKNADTGEHKIDSKRRKKAREKND